MRRFSIALFVAAVAVCLLAQPAFAAVELGRPYDSGNLGALQGVFDDITVGPTAGDSSIDVVADQKMVDLFSVTGSGASVSTIVIELATYKGTNKFGVYDPTSPTSTVEIFDGAAGAGSQAVLSIMADGSVKLNFADTGIDFAGNTIGFYLEVPDEGAVFYTQDVLNGDADGDDYYDPHALIYQGKNVDTVKLPGLAPGLWTDNEWVIAFEDLPFSSPSDQDFTDFVVMVESVTPVPEASSLAIWGLLALIGATIYRRKRG
ncbi:MAG: DUF4114 domain-containing protein [Pirellulales bacterium]|nr:DUF4114 domain-containing protein [Pirellulales bacterium]